jgi:hypothetical protein
VSPAALATPQSCGSCGASCPGLGQATADVACMNPPTCSFTCKGENYDVDGMASSGCERIDSPTGQHTQTAAVSLGSLPCTDASSAFPTSGAVPSDTRQHTNPAVTGFDTISGSAPDWFHILATGGTFCTDDISFTLNVTTPAPASCYRARIITDRMMLSCTASGSGTCTITAGSGAYTDGSDIYIVVDRTCAASFTNMTYTFNGHL